MPCARSRAWDCGFPDPSPATQYTASSFAQPIRRVFGTLVFRARERVEMPPPGELRAGALRRSSCAISIWDTLYAPIAGAVGFAADRLNHLQFLTIRRYLSLVFVRARHPASGAGAMAVILDLAIQGAQMLLVLLLAPLLTGLVRKVKARLSRRRGPAAAAALSRSRAAAAQGGGARRRTPPGCSASTPYLIFAATWVAAALVPTFATGLIFSWSADLIAIIALLGSARFFLALAGMDVGTSFGGIGSSREVMIASLAEPAMMMIVFTLALHRRLDPALDDRRLHALARPSGCASRSASRWSRSSSWRSPRTRASRSTIRRPISSSPWCTRRWCWNIPAAIWR